MKFSKVLTISAAVIAAGSALFGSSVLAAGVEVGTLTCEPIQGTKRNLLIHSSVEVDCVFEGGSVKENYKGETGIALGVDLNWKQDEVVKWVVIAPTSDQMPIGHALAGKYAGAKAEATAGVGAQANALVGGGDKSFTLQPLSLGGQTGFGAAGGLGYLYLEAN